jgi:hypothetical protein
MKVLILLILLSTALSCNGVEHFLTLPDMSSSSYPSEDPQLLEYTPTLSPSDIEDMFDPQFTESIDLLPNVPAMELRSDILPILRVDNESLPPYTPPTSPKPTAPPCPPPTRPKIPPPPTPPPSPQRPVSLLLTALQELPEQGEIPPRPQTPPNYPPDPPTPTDSPPGSPSSRSLSPLPPNIPPIVQAKSAQLTASAPSESITTTTTISSPPNADFSTTTALSNSFTNDSMFTVANIVISMVNLIIMLTILILSIITLIEVHRINNIPINKCEQYQQPKSRFIDPPNPNDVENIEMQEIRH